MATVDNVLSIGSNEPKSNNESDLNHNIAPRRSRDVSHSTNTEHDATFVDLVSPVLHENTSAFVSHSVIDEASNVPNEPAVNGGNTAAIPKLVPLDEYSKTCYDA